MLVQNQSQLGKGLVIPTDPHHTPTIIQPSTQPQKTQQPTKPKRKDTQVPQSSDPIENVADEAVHKELGDSLVWATTTASSLEAEQESGGGPRCHKTMGDTTAQTRFGSVSKHYNDLVLARGNTLRSDEDRLKLDELMALCTNLQNWVLELEKTKTTQHNEIASLKRRGRIDAIDVDEEITLVSIHDVNVTAGEEVFDAEQEVYVNEVNDDMTLAQTLMEIKSTKSKIKGVVIQELGESTTIISLQQSQDKAEFDEEERLAREKAEKEEEANIDLIETWDDIQAKINVDHQLAERMQAQEQEELSIKEKAT
ncbi:hypothetical protein Tco_0271307 [Tanacetum coccineum]